MNSENGGTPPQPTVASADCWADALSRTERRALAGKLARACGEVYRTRLHWIGTADQNRMITGCIQTSMDMSDLHLDVTERAEVATS